MDQGDIRIAAKENAQFKSWLLSKMTYQTFAPRLGITKEDVLLLAEQALAILNPPQGLNYVIAIIRLFCMLEQHGNNQVEMMTVLLPQAVEEINNLGLNGYVMDDHLIGYFLGIEYQNVQVIRARANARLALHLAEIYDLEN